MRVVYCFAALEMKCSDGEILLTASYDHLTIAEHLPWTAYNFEQNELNTTQGFNGAQLNVEGMIGVRIRKIRLFDRVKTRHAEKWTLICYERNNKE